jgi:very-short-patch-repair endonuclease
MPELMKLLLLIGGLFLFVGLLWLIATKLGMLKTSKESAATDEVESPEARYAARGYVLSPAERSLLPVLEEAVRMLAAERRLPVPRVFASVRLAEVLEVDRSVEGRSARQSAQNRIQSKQADFVVCHPQDTLPLLIVELDDGSHARPDRRERDEFVDRACASAGLPILHVRAAASYDVRRLAAEIAAKLPLRT